MSMYFLVFYGSAVYIYRFSSNSFLAFISHGSQESYDVFHVEVHVLKFQCKPVILLWFIYFNISVKCWPDYDNVKMLLDILTSGACNCSTSRHSSLFTI
jgi:hypothetical protein